MPRIKAAGDATFWKKILKRSALIFLIGFVSPVVAVFYVE
jgi:hypothetical protein